MEHEEVAPLLSNYNGMAESGEIVRYTGRRPEKRGELYVVAFWDADDVSEDELGNVYEEPHAYLFKYINDEAARDDLDFLTSDCRTPASMFSKAWERTGRRVT